MALVSVLGMEDSGAREGKQRVYGVQRTSWRGEQEVPGAQGRLGAQDLGNSSDVDRVPQGQSVPALQGRPSKRKDRCSAPDQARSVPPAEQEG